MRDVIVQTVLLVLFLLLAVGYYGTTVIIEIDKVFLTLATFLFALFSGFFIARQAGRYGDLRKLTADFDGNMSSIYRAFGHYSLEAQESAGNIIAGHYHNIVAHGWDYPLTHKTTTLTNLHTETASAVAQNGTDGVKGAVTTRIMLVLSDVQKIRKQMVALRDERIPGFQWMLVYLLTAILVFVVSTIDSSGFLLGSIVKAAFVIAVVSVVTLLRRLDNLQLFSGSIGENSARDVIEIIKGTR